MNGYDFVVCLYRYDGQRRLYLNGRSDDSGDRRRFLRVREVSDT
jgi:hypothetical protein